MIVMHSPILPKSIPTNQHNWSSFDYGRHIFQQPYANVRNGNCWVSFADMGIDIDRWPSWKLHIESKQKGINCGNINTCSVDTCIFCYSWMLDFPSKETGLLEFGFSFNVVVQMGTIALSLILAHFNRRLSWGLVKFMILGL